KDWQEIFLKNDRSFESGLYASNYDDYGWYPVGVEPFLNDDTQLPHSVIDFLVLPKTLLYPQGVAIVEEVDAYAAALCSTHYMRFMENNTRPEVQTYMAHEKKQTKRILTDLAIDQATFDDHVALLQFADNISLYVCLNEPGVSQSNVH